MLINAYVVVNASTDRVYHEVFETKEEAYKRIARNNFSKHSVVGEVTYSKPNANELVWGVINDNSRIVSRRQFSTEAEALTYKDYLLTCFPKQVYRVFSYTMKDC